MIEERITTEFVEAADYLLRSVAQRWAIPEFISSDPSNGNFASICAEVTASMGHQQKQLPET